MMHLQGFVKHESYDENPIFYNSFVHILYLILFHSQP